MIGVGVIALAAAATIVTGGAGAGVAGYIAAGALKGAIIGGAAGAVGGAGGGAIHHRVSTGSWKGAGKAALKSGARGFMTGAITGAVIGAGGRGIKTARSIKVAKSSLPIRSKRYSSAVRLRKGKIVQRRYYNIKGKAHYDLDYINHGNPKAHAEHHGHKITYKKKFTRSKTPINPWWWRWLKK